MRKPTHLTHTLLTTLSLGLAACGGGGGDPADTLAPVTLASPLGGTYQGAQSVSLTCDDGQGSGCAGTYYTVDGSAPTTASTAYASPIPVTEDTTLRFFSVDAAGNQESARSERFVISPVLPDTTPPVTSASPVGGTYTAAQSVTLLCDDGAGSGCAATHYTLDGTIPTTASPVYAAPLEIAADTQLRFFSVDQAGNSEAVRSESYIIEATGDVNPPVTTASPAGGTYTEAIAVRLTCDDGAGSGCAATYYTLDGSPPTTASAVYAAPIPIAADTVLRFFSADYRGNQEQVKTEIYVIDAGDLTPPVTTASPPGGSYTAAQSVTLACDDGAGSGCQATYFTLDGSLPTTASPVYAAPLELSVSTTLRFFSVDLEGNQEQVRREIYEIQLPSAMRAEWLGAYGATGSWQTGDGCTPGSGDGMLRLPSDVLPAGGHLYIVDSENKRVVKVEAASGAFVGWIGGIGQPPTGGAAGCAGAVSGELTPGWCTGGTGAWLDLPGAFSAPYRLATHQGVLLVSDMGRGRINRYEMDSGAYLGAIEGLMNPSALAVDGTYLYATEDGGQRISRILLLDGSFQGWTGRAETMPDACENGLPAAVPGATGGWCVGGTSASGSLDGEFNRPFGLAYESGKLYVADLNNSRIQRFDAVMGTFEGWLGQVAGTSPALGEDCEGQAVGYVAQGWCTGGTQQASQGNHGELYYPQAIAAHGGVLYVSGLERVSRYDAATGAYLGWTGRIGPTAPEACELGVPDPFQDVPTGSWCIGGETNTMSTTLDGALGGPGGLAAAGASLYVAEYSNSRIQEFDLTTGSSLHWLAAYPVALDAWSTQNVPGPVAGNEDGMLASPTKVVIDEAADRMYVAELNRISRFAASTGEFLGWTGRTASMPESCEGPMPAVVPGPTGGWCTGGSPERGWGDGELNYNAGGLLLHGGFLYASDSSNGRIVRFTLEGAFAGWIGQISGTDGLGPTACATAGSGAFSPTWCTGGYAASYARYIGSPYDLAIVGNVLYASDVSRHRINRIHLQAGEAIVYGGWTGRVGPEATDRPDSCDGGVIPEAGGVTNDWCYGGSSQPGVTDGALNQPFALAADGQGNLYAGGDDRRLSIFSQAGAYLGQAVSEPLQSVRGLFIDPIRGELLVGHGPQVAKFDLTTGQLIGWAGGVGAVPTGGDPGCTDALPGAFTPGWCTGGSALQGTGSGMIIPFGLFATDSWIYVADPMYNRVTRFDREQQ
jgi:hypothetical protein